MTERINFTEDIHHHNVSATEPSCMSDKPKVSAGARFLNEDEMVVAKKELINKSYLRVVRQSHDKPITNQNFSVFYFIPSKGATPDQDGCFGVMKNRGNFPTAREAEEHAEAIIETIDSFNENMIGYVGRDFPITCDPKYCLTTKEVDVRNKLDSITKNNIREIRANDKKEMEEITEKRRELLEDTSETKEKAIDDLDFYITLRVKRANIRILQEECTARLKDCAKKLKSATSEINRMDEQYPEYIKEYESKYKTALDAIGSNDNKIIKYMK